MTMSLIPQQSDFDIGKPLGRGKNGVVYLVKAKRDIGQIQKGKLYALKVFFIHKDENEKRYKTEIRLALKLNHPNIVKCYSIFQEEKRVYFVLDYYKENNIYKRLKEISPEIVKQVIIDVLEALMYCHSQGITHRDIKPENILIDGNHFKLCDWDCAIVLKPDKSTNEVIGTLDYLPPEIVKGVWYHSDGMIDMWAVGCLVFELLFKSPPFEEESYAETYRRINKLDYKIPDSIDDLTKDFITKLLLISPKDRMSAKIALEHPYLK